MKETGYLDILDRMRERVLLEIYYMDTKYYIIKIEVVNSTKVPKPIIRLTLGDIKGDAMLVNDDWYILYADLNWLPNSVDFIMND
ncbi:hypothetical protein N9948_01880 [bacterium]|nr:hypothetical protein [bacterium]